MIISKREWRRFYDEEEMLEKLKEWKLVSPKASEFKKFYYKGIYTNEPVECEIIGFVDDNEIILNINDEVHSIHPDYLVDMQKKERFIIVDIETPHSFSPKDGIREVAAIVVEDYRVIDSLHLMDINNEEEYKKGYGAGLDAIEENEELRDKFTTLINKYKYPLVAHNASFDRSFLRYWNWVDNKREFYCSMNTIKSKEKLESYKLVNLLSYFNIKEGQAHNAMQDVLDLLSVLKIVRPDKWHVLGESKNNYSSNNKSRNYEVDKQKREDDKRKLELAKENIIKNIFNGKRIVFTGDMTKGRTEMREIAIKYGAISIDSVSKKTDFLVVGENAGSKLAKARQFGINIINEEEFWNIIKKKVI